MKIPKDEVITRLVKILNLVVDDESELVIFALDFLLKDIKEGRK